MKNIFLITCLGFKEALRSKTLQALFIFAIILIASSRLFSFFTLGEEMKIIKDIGLASISLFGMLIALITGSGQIPHEIESKTIYTILSNPVERREFILGKFLGVVFVVLFTSVVMIGIFYIVLFFKERAIDLALFKGILLILLQVILLGSIAFFFSTFLPSAVNIVCCIIVYIAGHLNSLLFAGIENIAFPANFLMRLLSILLPHLENFNVSDSLVLGKKLSSGYLGIVFAYGLIYIIIILLLTHLSFQRKEV